MQSKDKGGEGTTRFRADYTTDLRVLRSEKEEFEKSNKLKIGDLNKRLVEKQQQFTSGLMEVEKIKTDFEYKLGKAQLIAKLLEEEKRDSEEIMKKYIESAEAKYLVRVEDLRQKLEQSNKKYEQSRKALMIKENEFETEKLLLEQKLLFTQKALVSAKERILEQDRKLSMSSNNSKLQKSTVGEKDAKFYQEEIASLKQILRDRETQKLRLQDTVNCLRQRESLKIKSLEEQLNQQKARVRSQGLLTAEVQSWTMKYRQLADEMQSVKQKLQSVERAKSKEVGELKSERNQLQKHNAIIRQQIQFSKAEVNELKGRIQEMEKASKTEFAPIQNTSNSDSLRRIESMLEQQRNQFKLKQQTYLANIKSIGLQLQKALKESSDKELQLAIQQRKHEQTVRTMEGYVASSKDIVKQLQDRLSTEDTNRMSVTNKYKAYYETKLQSLEQEVQKLRQARQSSNNECHEQELTMIKNYYEQEKMHLQNKISQQKERYARSLQETVRELRQKHLEQIRIRQDNEQDLKCQLQEVWGVSSNKISQLESKLQVKQYELSNSLSRMQKVQQQLKSMLQQSEMEFRRRQNQLQQSCKQLREKCQKLRIVVNQRQKTVQQLSDNKQALERQLSKITLQMADNEDRHCSQIRDLNLLVQNGRHKYQQIFDESFFKQTEAQKRLALSEQSNRFNEEKIRQLENNIKQQRKAYQKQLSELKKELQTEGNQRAQQLKKQLERVTAKYTQLKKVAKESQLMLTKQLNDAKVTAELYAERCRDLQLKIVEWQKSSIEQQQKFKHSLLELKSQAVEERQRSALEVRRLQSQILEIENQKGLIEGEYEKDKILWSSKIQFLESQKSEIKQDASQKIKRMEEAMEFLQRGKTERSLNSIPDALSNIERSYHVKLIQASDNYLRKQLQLQDKVKLLEVQLKLQQNKNIQCSVRGGSQTLEKTIQSYRENQKKLSNQIQKLRLEKETLRIENSKLLNSQKDLYRQKIKQIEQKNRQAQTKRSLMMFEHEKEAAKWRQQKAMLKQNIQELQQQLGNIKQNNRKLQKENEQFRTDKRKHKVNGSLVSSLTNSFASSVNRNMGAVRFDRFKGDNFKDYSIFGSPVQGSEHSQGSQNPHEDLEKPYEL